MKYLEMHDEYTSANLVHVFLPFISRMNWLQRSGVHSIHGLLSRRRALQPQVLEQPQYPAGAGGPDAVSHPGGRAQE